MQAVVCSLLRACAGAAVATAQALSVGAFVSTFLSTLGAPDSAGSAPSVQFHAYSHLLDMILVGLAAIAVWRTVIHVSFSLPISYSDMNCYAWNLQGV